MDRSVLLGALLVLLANVSVSQAPTVEKYFKAGGTLQLSPQPVSAPITSVLWKYGKNLLAEWAKDFVPLTYYSKYKGRTSLNTNTGELEIRGMTAADAAVYSVEVNKLVQSQVYQAVEIEDVPLPKVEAKPLGCSSASESCKLVCDGNVSKAGPVEYFWKKDDGLWEKSDTNTIEIVNDEETKGVKTFTCRMKNPFSEEDSTAFDNRFYETATPANSSSVVGGVVGGVVAVLLLVLAGVAYWKREKIPCLNRSAPNPANPAENKELMGVRSDPVNNSHNADTAQQPSDDGTHK